MSETVKKSFEFEARGVSRTLSDIRQLIRVLNIANASGVTMLGWLTLLGLPRDVNAAIRALQQIVLTLQAVRAAAIAAHISLGPLGWVLAGVGVVGGAVAIEVSRREYEW